MCMCVSARAGQKTRVGMFPLKCDNTNADEEYGKDRLMLYEQQQPQEQQNKSTRKRNNNI